MNILQFSTRMMGMPSFKNARKIAGETLTHRNTIVATLGKSSLVETFRSGNSGNFAIQKRLISTIPYDPSLVLGNIVHQDRVAILERISDHQSKIDAAQANMDSYITLERNLELLRNDLVNMKMPTEGVADKIKDVQTKLGQSIEAYAKVCIDEYPLVQDLYQQLRLVHVDVESPIDYNKTQYKSTPISVNSLKFDCQYFSFDKNSQTAQSMAATISGYVSAAMSGGGFFESGSYSSQVSNSTQKQVTHQYSNHDIEGTLVITANCTHKNAIMLAPFILDVDKAIRVWNQVFTEDKDKIKMNDASAVMQIAKQEGTKDEKKMKILSGVTYGSSFVGMVHVLRTEGSESGQSLMSTANTMQGQFEVGNWFSHESGGVGLDSSFSTSMKNMLSTASVSSHVSLVVMGTIPSIKSNQVQSAVQGFTDFSPDKMMGQLAVLQNATNDSQKSIASSAESARTGGQMIAIEGQKIKSAVAAVGDIDSEQNQIINTASLMQAFEDYVKQAASGEAGVPINYYIKDVTRAQLAQMWMAKYLPDVGMINISGDDSAGEKASAVGGDVGSNAKKT